LSGSGTSSSFYSQPNEKGEESPANVFWTDEHGMNALGVKLSGGTTFEASAVKMLDSYPQFMEPTAIVSQGFAKALFPNQNALGKTFYDNHGTPHKIVGIIEHMHGSWVGWDKVDRVIFSPMVGPKNRTRYVVRAAPGELDRVMADAEVALRKRDANRVISKFRKMSDQKRSSYAGDSVMAVTLSTVTGLVLIFSSLGIFGLATFNVNTRTKQIGTRRAVGARKRDIVRHFMTENWLITTLGVTVGCCLALAAGFWLSSQYDLPRLDLYYLVGGVLGLWVVGQVAAWQPSRKAAKVSPAMATRTV
jgi:putative ABC transport system permease protein